MFEGWRLGGFGLELASDWFRVGLGCFQAGFGLGWVGLGVVQGCFRLV